MRPRWLAIAVVLTLGGVLGLRAAGSRDSQHSPAAVSQEARVAADTTAGAAVKGGPGSAPDTADAAPSDTAGAPAALRAPSAAELAKISYEREFYYYDGAGRRDPFKPLLDVDVPGQGPRFEELVLTGLFIGEKGNGMVVVEDAKRKGYFLKPGDTVGKATLVEIHPDEAVFEVRDLGISRRETLKLQRPEETS